MDRLTHWNGKKWVLPQGCWREIAERLAAYENTGLEPEQITAMQQTEQVLDSVDKPDSHDFFTATILVHDEAGNVPCVDHTNGNAYLHRDEIEANVDNPEVMQEPGINHFVIAVHRDHWHVVQVWGYTTERGMYAKTY